MRTEPGVQREAFLYPIDEQIPLKELEIQFFKQKLILKFPTKLYGKRKPQVKESTHMAFTYTCTFRPRYLILIISLFGPSWTILYVLS